MSAHLRKTQHLNDRADQLGMVGPRTRIYRPLPPHRPGHRRIAAMWRAQSSRCWVYAT